MARSIRLISTDFDGTLFAEFENPPVPRGLQRLIGGLQEQGARWVINTGRDLSNLLESLTRAQLSIRPDYLVLVEREIYVHRDHQYEPLVDWNLACRKAHAALFDQVRPEIPRLAQWIQARYPATVYEDPYSPFCLIAENNADADAILHYLDGFCARVPSLTVVRNDVYARFSHVGFSKGTALGEIARRLSLKPHEIFAAGDHFNDLPMLRAEWAQLLAAPVNAIAPVKDQVRRLGGFVSDEPCGFGVLRALEYYLDPSKLDHANPASHEK